jgi:hypothetical protein
LIAITQNACNHQTVKPFDDASLALVHRSESYQKFPENRVSSHSEPTSFVIARSEATKQFRVMLNNPGLLRFARNDE